MRKENTLEMLQQVNMSACAGFICGMGETDEQLIDLAFELREFETTFCSNKFPQFD